MGSSGRILALVTARELGEVTVVVTLPIPLSDVSSANTPTFSHLVVEDLGLSGLGLGDQAVVENIENILANLLELELNLLTVLADDADVLVCALLLLLLLDGGDDAP